MPPFLRALLVGLQRALHGGTSGELGLLVAGAAALVVITVIAWGGEFTELVNGW